MFCKPAFSVRITNVPIVVIIMMQAHRIDIPNWLTLFSFPPNSDFQIPRMPSYHFSDSVSIERNQAFKLYM